MPTCAQFSCQDQRFNLVGTHNIRERQPTPDQTLTELMTANHKLIRWPHLLDRKHTEGPELDRKIRSSVKTLEEGTSGATS